MVGLLRRIRRLFRRSDHGDAPLAQSEVATVLGLDSGASGPEVLLRLEQLKQLAALTPEERLERRIGRDFRKHVKPLLDGMELDDYRERRRAERIVEGYWLEKAARTVRPKQPDDDDSAQV